MEQSNKNKPVLEVKNLTKRYDDRREDQREEVISNLNFTMYPGEFVCILGPSGCGKTTFLRDLIYLHDSQVLPSPIINNEEKFKEWINDGERFITHS